jgi:hypothetical protein
MIFSINIKIVRLFFAVLLAFASGARTSASAAEAVCGTEFDASKFGFVVQPLEPDEASGCGRFLKSFERNGADGFVVSVVVSNAPASRALKTMPNNFAISGDGSISFKRPRPVSDSKLFYFVKPVGVVHQSKHTMSDGSIYIAEHKRRVKRLKKINDSEDQEVDELQLCVDALRTTATSTLLVSACDLADTQPRISSRLLPLLRSAKFPEMSHGRPQR